MEERYSVRLSRFSARRGDEVYLDGADLDINKGDIVFLLGKNGCGKSTVLSLFRSDRSGGAEFGGGFHVINGTESYNIVQSNLREAGFNDFYLRSIAYLDQSDLLEAYTSVERAIRYPTDAALKRRLATKAIDKKTFSEKKQKTDALVKECLEELNRSAELAGDGRVKRAAKLSGGQKRLVCFFRTYIRASVLEPVLLVLDEPLNHLDCRYKQTIDKKLTALMTEREQKGDPITILIVSHCLSLSLINHKNCKQFVFRDGKLFPLEHKKFFPCIEDADYLGD